MSTLRRPRMLKAAMTYEQKWKYPVEVPIPPKLEDMSPEFNLIKDNGSDSLYPTKAIVCIINGKEGRDLYEVSGLRLKTYANRIGVDFIPIFWEGNPSWPMSAKYAIYRSLEHYNRIAYFDLDIIVDENTVNIFECCEDSKIGLLDEFPMHQLRKDTDGVIKECLRLATTLNLPNHPLTAYYNCGVMVLSKQHISLLYPPHTPIPPLHCAEQHLFNLRLRESAFTVKSIDSIYNWNYWWRHIDNKYSNVPKNAVYHFAGLAHDPKKRLYHMRKHIGLHNPKMVDNAYGDGLLKVLNQLKPNYDYYVKSHPESGCRGIIYVGGGKYWPGILTGIRMLRHLGCELPIEVWYRPEAGETVSIVDDNTTFHVVPGDGGKHGGWAAKSYALYNTSLKEVLYLDADAYCVENPESLFDLLKNNPFLYWQDLPRQQTSVKWEHVYPDGEMADIPCVQGGQLLIDREKAWKLIHAMKYMCDNRDYYFKYMYGDQDTWRVGLAAETSTYRVLEKAVWRQSAFICSYNKTPYIVHRCQGKLFKPEDIPVGNVKYSQPVAILPREREVFEIFHEIINANINSIKTFENVYNRQLWGPYTQIGGSGSRKSVNREYINYVNKIIRENDFKTIIDLGCSEGTIASELQCEEYIGYDCVENQLEQAKRKYRNYTFVQLDIYSQSDIIQYGDILLCKDVLHHWPNLMIERFLESLIKLNKWKMILITVDKLQQYNGQDTYLGGYRALDSKMYPLNRFNITKELEYRHKVIYRLNGV